MPPVFPACRSGKSLMACPAGQKGRNASAGQVPEVPGTLGRAPQYTFAAFTDPRGARQRGDDRRNGSRSRRLEGSPSRNPPAASVHAGEEGNAPPGDGAPDRIRTCDLWLRRPTLYPTELRAPDLKGPDSRRIRSPSEANEQGRVSVRRSKRLQGHRHPESACTAVRPSVPVTLDDRTVAYPGSGGQAASRRDSHSETT